MPTNFLDLPDLPRSAQFDTNQRTTVGVAVRKAAAGYGRKSIYDWSYTTPKTLLLVQTAPITDASTIPAAAAVNLSLDGQGQVTARGANRTMTVFVLPAHGVTLTGAKLNLWIDALWEDNTTYTTAGSVVDPATILKSTVDDAVRWTLYKQVTISGTPDVPAVVFTGLPTGSYRAALAAGTWTGNVYIVEQHTE